MKIANNNKLFRFTVLMCIFFASVFMLSAQNTNFPVGAIPGAVDVSPMGAASYTIPIEVVPGTQGVQPNLSIVYNSFSGMGLLGMKWSLAGLSAITRCGQNYYYDGEMTAIQFNNKDRFAIDGSRLLMQDVGNYGDVGKPYATEVENFMWVVSYGGSAGTPNHFKAFTDDGTIIEYGNTGDSWQLLSGNILSWNINKITDANGNFMSFSYGGANGEIYINEINYTGNTAAGIATYAQVLFTYGDIPADKGKNTYFVGGYAIPQTKLLKTITIKYSNAQVRKYQFNYAHETAQDERTAHLKEVVLFGDNNNTQLKATKIEWGEQNTVFASMHQISNLYNGEFITGDFNGDGYTDIIFFNGTGSTISWKLYLNAMNNTFYSSTTGTHLPDNTYYVYDLDMDGQDELITGIKYGDTTKFISQRFFPSHVECDIGSVGHFKRAYFGRFHSNGMTDVLFECTPGILNHSILVDRWGTIVKDLRGYGKVDTIYIVDLNGNGVDDVQVVINNKSLTYEFQSGALTPIKTLDFPTEDHIVYYGDFNGDGIKDALVYVHNGTSYVWLLHMGKGNNTFIQPGFQMPFMNADPDPHSEDSPIPPRNHVIIADINGDGKDEIVQAKNTGVVELCYLYLSNFLDNGSCTVTHKEAEYPSASCASYNYFLNYSNHYFSVGDFNGDGKSDILIHGCKKYAPYVPVIVYAHQNEQYDFTKQITDGMGKVIKLTYKPQYYTAENYIRFSAYNIFQSYHKYCLPVIETVQVSNGLGSALNTLQYFFRKATCSLSRRTFLGFKEFECLNIQVPVWYIDYQFFDFCMWNPKQMLVPTGRAIQAAGTLTSETSYAFILNDLPNKRIASYCAKETVYDYHTNTKTQAKVTINNQGRVIEKVTLTYSAHSANVNDWLHSETSSYFYKSITLAAPWQKKTVPDHVITTQQYKNNGPAITDIITYNYDAQGRLNWEQKENILGSIKTSYGAYTTTGLYGTKTVTAGNNSKTETYTYDDKHRAVKKIKNPLNHEANYTYYEKTLNKASEKGPNDLTTQYSYDAFGNLTSITYPDGIVSTNSIEWYTEDAIPNACYYTTTATPGQATVTTYYDLLGREVCRMEDGYYYDTRYNNKGQTTKTSYPYKPVKKPDSEKIWNECTYDLHGRMLTDTAPYKRLLYSYSNRKVTVTDQLRNNLTSSKDYDALGRLIKAEDDGGTITYAYTVTNDNQYKTTITAVGAITTILTDLWGNRLSIDDPSAGTITTTYNAFNEPITQVDARNNITTWQYDNLGRVTQKQFTDAENNQQTIGYVYDTSNKGKGKLAAITLDGQQAETYQYDGYSRLSEYKKKIDNTWFAYNYTYNANGQMFTLTYPDGFSIKYSYKTSNGKLNDIRRTTDNSLIYSIDETNAFGATTACKYGNGLATVYTYNPYGLLTRINTGNQIGHSPSGRIVDRGITFADADSSVLNYRYKYNAKGLMISRSERISNRLEEFSYDALDRLTGITFGNIGQTGAPQTITYSKNGNITANSAVGTYAYIREDVMVEEPNFIDRGGHSPHAVCKITPIDETVISPAQCDVIYNYFNQPTEITEDDYELHLFYNANQQRHKAMRFRDGDLKNTYYYISKHYEKEIDSANVTRHYHYIYGNNGIVALHIATPTTDSLYYIHTDHLGSYCAITNSAKKVRQSHNFDPWGNPIDQNFTITNRGFTGHEHYPEFKIINMNGRLYDPVIGRFFSPDKYVANSSFTQDFNRYSYARNCPLHYTDPSGEFIWALVPAIAWLGGMINTYMNRDNVNNLGQALGYFGIGAVAGGAGAAAGAGAFAAVGASGFLGGMASGAAGRLTGGFINGAGNTWMQGGNFGQGLLAGLKSGAISGLIGGITGGLIGGIDAAMHGANFWNGSFTHYNTVPTTSTMTYKEAVAHGKLYDVHELANRNDAANITLLKQKYGDDILNLIDPSTRARILSNGKEVGLNEYLQFVFDDGTTANGYVTGFYRNPPPYQTGISASVLSNPVDFHATAGHEIIHATLRTGYQFFGDRPDIFRTNGEAAATNFTYNVYLNAGRFNAANFHLSRGIIYPDSYRSFLLSWWDWIY